MPVKLHWLTMNFLHFISFSSDSVWNVLYNELQLAYVQLDRGASFYRQRTIKSKPYWQPLA